MIRIVVLALIFLTGCKRTGADADVSGKSSFESRKKCGGSWSRDFASKPSIIIKQDLKNRAYFLGDIHGESFSVAELLKTAGLDRGTLKSPVWAGGQSILVVAGDLMDKGSDSLGVIQYFMELQAQASRAGGTIVVLAGNHEVAFLLNPENEKTIEFQKQIRLASLDLCLDVYSENSKVGRWLRDLPAAVVINGIFVSHTGFPKWSLQEIDSEYRAFFSSSGTNSKFACGDVNGAKHSQGFFTAQTWWKRGVPFLNGTQKLGVGQIMFGHDPGAFKSRGRVEGYFGDSAGRALIKLDVGLVTKDSPGEILRCDRWAPVGSCQSFSVLTRASARNSGVIEKPISIINGPPPEQDEGEPQEEC